MKKILLSSGLSVLLLVTVGCTPKSFHNEMLEKQKEALNKDDLNNLRSSYSESLIENNEVKQKYISILEDKTLSEVLNELENMENKIYFLKSNDILIPRSRIKIHTVQELSNYLNAVIDKSIVVEKNGNLNLVTLLNTSERKKLSINSKRFILNGQLSVEELLKLITNESGYNINLANTIENRNDFQNSIINLNSKTLGEALNSLASSKDVYVDIDYEKESINISRYKDIVIELNIPLLDMSSSSQTSNQESSSGSKIENKSSIVLYEELDKMIKSIISNDRLSTYHIDKASGLIFLKSTKNIENAVRTLAKAYESSFSKEAIVEFERVELILNKDRTFGILGANIINSSGSSLNIGEIEPASSSSIVFDQNTVSRNLKLLAQSENNIGRILNYSRNMLVLKNNIPTVQAITENTDYIEKIETTRNSDTNEIDSDVTVNTLKEGTSITASAKISRDKIFLNLTPSIKKLISWNNTTLAGGNMVSLPKYNDQEYNISREVKLGETSIVGSIIVHDDAKEYDGIIPIDGFAVGGKDSKSYVRREIVYVITLREIKGF
ncbi:hypothetical protein [Aliarcobacter skirrowii]|uniref:Type II and III secretion system protein n=1 Tax=Aliarcobacter skirrowii CCUG 10374 TaxID=1032239 RepID=A0AAD0SL41_9BACT|nr:hypothetical protein [Aliarcobacter skirrowii]AXX84727.1 hypothetical protein ASKIR_0910 [Aliarcobacter skirrowii CCUG 10374]KAB0620272.1 hypothetical protein F7P70_08465 [Aliarcobacter skirrowii CCUG 10374]RXI25455.1 hypothetical protein CP959_08495 [Aliarcobacter skirrowii CCUG 10374]SUV14900.1 pilus (MSHA type) biogenesis protein MshL [Aliarcobacter skirrowii]